MKKIVILLWWFIPTLLRGQENVGINFSQARSWQEVLKEAQEAGKPIFVDVYATWCIPCKKMDKEVYSDRAVADFVNAHFIALKVQMDTTARDDEFVKGWRMDASKFRQYATSFPTFLFFTSDGVYAGKESGFREPKDFTALLTKAIDSNDSYPSQIARFKKGNLGTQQLLELAYRAKSNNEDSIANQIAKEYKIRYVDRQPVDSLLNEQADRFHSTFINLFNFDDKIIQYIYHHPDSADVKFRRWPKYSRNLTDFVISRDYIYKYISANQIPATAVPNWKKIEKAISKDFDRKLAKRLILDAKIGLSYQQKDYTQTVQLEIEKIDRYGLDTSVMGRTVVNNLFYDVAFKHVDDPSVLKKALPILKKIVDVEKSKNHSHLDTYASILYKVGKKQKAIEIERMALAIATNNKDSKNMAFYQDVISKMENGIAIWEETDQL